MLTGGTDFAARGVQMLPDDTERIAIGSADYLRWIDASLLSDLRPEKNAVWSVSVVVCETRGQHPLARFVTMSVWCPDSQNGVSLTAPADGLGKDACACVGVMRAMVMALLVGAKCVICGISAEVFGEWLTSPEVPWERLRMTLRQAGDFCVFSCKPPDPDAVAAVKRTHALRRPEEMVRALNLRWEVAKKIQWMADYVGDFYPSLLRKMPTGAE